MKAELDILKSISQELIASGSDQRNLKCPICGHPNAHISAPYMILDDDWHGNGELAIIPLSSECGSEWHVCIGSHKGDAPIFVRVNKTCE